MSKPEMSTVTKKERVRAVAELMAKRDEGKITEGEFAAEYARLMAGMPPTALLRIMSLYRRLAQEPEQWDAPLIPHQMKPPTDEGTA
jgi:hypothetical protein